MYVCIYVCMYIYICMYVCMYACMYVWSHSVRVHSARIPGAGDLRASLCPGE